ELITLAVSGLVAVTLIRFHDMKYYWGRVLFYTSLAIAVVPAIYSLGVVLVFSLLVIPGLAVWRHGQVGNTWLAISLASLASTAGIFMSNYYDYPPSSAVVVFLAALALFGRVLLIKKSANQQ
ncbi:MAG: metal ABC transporter permease, partial [Ghiorsea sp.]|nr:metal ABC transporter permease [Ghiorsea sp.]